MIVKVCGMRDSENIREVAALGVDMIGMIFVSNSERFVPMVSSCAGIIPDYGEDVCSEGNQRKRPAVVGVFVDDMPQNIVTRIYNYNLDYVQLHGEESAVMIDNLRRTVDPDIHPGLKIIKAISIASENDVKRWREYEGHVDMLLFDAKGDCAGGNGKHFDWQWLSAYDGNIPFLLSGGICLDDAEEMRRIKHPMFAGVDINSRFELSPALKDVGKIKEFVERLNGC